MTEIEMNGEVGTSIHVTKQTKRLMDTFKVIPRESYESVILRLIEGYRKHHAPRKQEDDPPAGQTTLAKQEA